MIEAIIASTLTVYVLLGLFSVILLIAAYHDSMGVAFWSTVIGLVLLQLVSSADPWGYVRENPKDIAFWALAYFPIGVGWSLFRWWRVLKDKAAKLLEEKDSFVGNYRAKTWEEYVKQEMPRADRHKSAIACWITYWPFSAACYLLVDILCDIGNWIYSMISGLYQRMADSITNSISG